MASRLSKEALNWLRSFIEGEEEFCDAKILAELKGFAVSKSEPLFRGLFFDTKENFLEKMKIESGAKSFSFSYKALESFTDSEDVAEAKIISTFENMKKSLGLS
jgi:hypothetical protein